MPHFLDISEQSPSALQNMLDLAVQLKKEPYSNHSLANKTVGLLFEKPSLRTRVSFEVGITQCGGTPITLQQDEVGLGKRESIQDVAQVLSRFVDMLMVRTFSHDTVKTLANYASIPVINGLTDYSHPCQAMADLLTIYENFQTLKGLRCVYLGDGNNVCRSFMQVSEAFGMHTQVCVPDGHECTGYPHGTDPDKAIANAQVIYTDAWVSMGETNKSIDPFKPYQVNAELLSKAAPDAIVLHCLPAHRGEEITDDVIDSAQSKVFDQAENRLHAQKAIMAHLFQK